MKRSMMLALLGLALATVSVVAASAQQTPAYTPAKTKVAILPIVNKSPEKWAELRQRQEKQAVDFLRQEFKGREFDLVSADAVQQSLTRLKIDLTDEENWRRDTFYNVGQDTGAQIVLFVTITATEQKRSNNFFSVRLEGWTDMKAWMVDAAQKQAIINAKTIRGISKHDDVFGAGKGSDLRVISVAKGLRDLLAEFFAPYPMKVKPPVKDGGG